MPTTVDNPTSVVEIGDRQVVLVDVGFQAADGLPSGEPGQVIGYDAQGNPVAVDPASASLPPGQPGQVLGYNAQGVAVPIDPPAPNNIDLGTFN